MVAKRRKTPSSQSGNSWEGQNEKPAPAEGWGEDPAIRASPEDRQPPESDKEWDAAAPEPAAKPRKRVKAGSSEAAEGAPPVAMTATAAPLPPDQMGDNARAMLIGFVERFERLDEERKAVMEDQKELLAEIKSAGFDKATFRKAITRRRMDPVTREAADALLDLYESIID